MCVCVCVCVCVTRCPEPQGNGKIIRFKMIGCTASVLIDGNRGVQDPGSVMGLACIAL